MDKTSYFKIKNQQMECDFRDSFYSYSASIYHVWQPSLLLVYDLEDANKSAFIHVAFLTFSIGVIPTVASVLFHYHQITTNKLSRLIDNNSSLEKKSIGKTLTIESTNKTEKEVTIKLNELLYIEAIKNHIHIHYLFNGEKESKIIRNTLSQIEETMGSLPLFRCHRSYIINLDKIKNAKGNSNGYKITLQDCDTTIPVSRSYVSKFTQLIY